MHSRKLGVSSSRGGDGHVRSSRHRGEALRNVRRPGSWPCRWSLAGQDPSGTARRAARRHGPARPGRRHRLRQGRPFRRGPGRSRISRSTRTARRWTWPRPSSSASGGAEPRPRPLPAERRRRGTARSSSSSIPSTPSSGCSTGASRRSWPSSTRCSRSAGTSSSSSSPRTAGWSSSSR
ncbi:MAG: hypothetical protein MZU91_11010 [Desulfosudis oleivorans]|nr:hypothetical protein [Desulfosudis oleivorans]